MKRLFIGIPLTEKIIKEASYVIDRLELELPSFRIVNSSLWHSTISFLGLQAEDDLLAITSAMDKAFEPIEPFRVQFTHIDYAPPNKDKDMIWLYGENEKFGKLKDKLEEELEEAQIEFKRDRKKAILHTTLARRKYQDPNTPEIKEEFKQKMNVKQVHLYEAYRSGGELTYDILYTVNL